MSNGNVPFFLLPPWMWQQPQPREAAPPPREVTRPQPISIVVSPRVTVEAERDGDQAAVMALIAARESAAREAQARREASFREALALRDVAAREAAEALRLDTVAREAKLAKQLAELEERLTTQGAQVQPPTVGWQPEPIPPGAKRVVLPSGTSTWFVPTPGRGLSFEGLGQGYFWQGDKPPIGVTVAPALQAQLQEVQEQAARAQAEANQIAKAAKEKAVAVQAAADQAVRDAKAKAAAAKAEAEAKAREVVRSTTRDLTQAKQADLRAALSRVQVASSKVSQDRRVLDTQLAVIKRIQNEVRVKTGWEREEALARNREANQNYNKLLAGHAPLVEAHKQTLSEYSAIQAAPIQRWA